MTSSRNAPTVAQYVDAQLGIADRTLRTIAMELGLNSPNLLSMFRKGQTKIPMKIAPALAKAMRCDPTYFTMLCLREYEPEVFSVIENTILKDKFVVTENEKEVIELLRQTNSGDPKIHDAQQRQAVQRAFETLA